MTSRAEFLWRIRAEMTRTPGLFEATPSPRPARPREQLDLLRRELSERWPDSLARFVREFERVGGVFHRVARVAEVPDVIASIAAEREMRKIVSWHPDALRLDLAGPLSGRGLQVSTMPGGEVTAAERERLGGGAAGGGGGGGGGGRRAPAPEGGLRGGRARRDRRGSRGGRDRHARRRVRSRPPALDVAAAGPPRCRFRSRRARRVTGPGRPGPRGVARELGGRHAGSGDQLHHRPQSHRRYRAHAHPGSSRTQGGPRGIRRGRPGRGSAWLSDTSSAKRSSG